MGICIAKSQEVHPATKSAASESTDDDVEAIVRRTWQNIEAGSYPKPQPASTKLSSRTVYVFVSSTFVDMHSEREVLVRQVGNET